MKRIVTSLMICLLFGNCVKKKEKTTTERQSYIISYEDKKNQNYYDSIERKNKIKIPPPPRKVFYSDNQLMIDKQNNLFFYQKEYVQILCDYGFIDDSIPEFLGIKPKDIVKIPQNSLNDFLSENILTKDRQVLIIASQNDTIKNISFLDFLNNNEKLISLIRRTTQEEDTVLQYKKDNKHYYSEDIKWNETKIKLLNKK